MKCFGLWKKNEKRSRMLVMVAGIRNARKRAKNLSLLNKSKIIIRTIQKKEVELVEA